MTTTPSPSHALDNNQTQHIRPGTDPFAGRSIPITAVTATTITVNVGTSSDTSAHTFVSATANAVNHLPQSAHTFVSAATNAITFAGNTANQFNAQDFLCSDVQAAIDTLNTIVQDVFTAGNLSSMPTEVNYGYGMGPGESKCARDIGYFIDAVSVDMFCEGNRHTKEFTRQYFTDATTPLSNGLVGEEAESVTAFNTAIAEMKRQYDIYYKDLTVTLVLLNMVDLVETSIDKILQHVLMFSLLFKLLVLSLLMRSLLVISLVVFGTLLIPLEHSSLVKLSVVEILVTLLMLSHRISGSVVTSILLLQLRNTSMVIL